MSGIEIVHFYKSSTFAKGDHLTPEHCDRLEAACLQNGDVGTIETIEKARRNWEDAKDKVFAILMDGYAVRPNDAPRII